MAGVTSDSTQTEMGPFDRVQLGRRRDRAAPNFADHSFLLDEVSLRLAERLDDIKRSFPLAVDLGCHDGRLAGHLSDRSGIEQLVQCDISQAMTAQTEGAYRVVADEEWLPFAAGRLDLVISALSLHWVNDLPGALIQIRRALKPDGLFLGAFMGGATLAGLRAAFLDAESELEGGASPRVSPFADVRDGGDLLQRAGFALPVANTETLEVSYAAPAALLADLRGMGETNAIAARRRTFLRKSTLARALALYQERHRRADGRVTASFEIIFLTGWAPGPGQPQALNPVSGQVSMTKVLGGDGGGD